MNRVRVAASVGVALVLLVIIASVWALSAVLVPRPPMELGEPITVPTALPSASVTTAPELSSTPSDIFTPSLTPSTSFSAIPTVPSTETAPPGTPPATTYGATRPGEAVRVSKPSAPRAGDDDDDVDDPDDDDADDLEDDQDDDDGDDD